MAPLDGAIGMKINLDLPQTTDANISKAQPSKVSGLGGVRCLRSKSAPILSIYYLDKIESLNLDTYVLGNGKADHKVSYTTKFVIMRRWSWAYLIAH